MAEAKRKRGWHVFKDRTGQTFGALTVIKLAPNVGKQTHWLCQCVCGNRKTVRSDTLYKLHAVYDRCTCNSAQKHGLSRTRVYSIWSKMLLRCYDEKNDNYRFYGAIGHYVCQRWRDSVEAFLEDMGQPPSDKHTLDRIDTNGHYTCGKCEECCDKNQPENCRWATKVEQSHNMKNNLWFTHNGETLILKDWARRLSIPYLKLYKRIYYYGRSFEEAITIVGDMRKQRHKRPLKSPTG
jgi:hypothetical protein